MCLAMEKLQIQKKLVLLEQFSIKCRKYLRFCFGFALLRSVIG